MNEIEILRYLNHPSIITLYEVFEAADYVHLVLEYLKGGELFDKIQEKGSYSEGDAAKIMKQLLETINYCHQRNVIHRDIKPENIILKDITSDLDFKIVDFGLAVRSAPGTKEMLRCGSPGYAAPEVLLKEGYNLKADIFSCGIIMCFLLTGITPFSASTIEEIIDRNKKCDFTLDGEAWKKISVEAKELLRELTARDPDKRITAEMALRHVWFTKDFTTAENLSAAQENMRKYSKESAGKNETPKSGKKPPELGSILTSSPLMGGRGLDLKETDSPIMSPNYTFLPRKPAFESRTSLFKPLVSAAAKEKEEAKDLSLFQQDGTNTAPLPNNSTHLVMPSFPQPDPTESSCCAIEDELTPEISIPDFRPRTNSIKAIPSFVPGESGCRCLPDAPGFLGGSRRITRHSVYVRPNRQVFTKHSTKETTAFPALLKQSSVQVAASEFPELIKQRSEALATCDNLLMTGVAEDDKSGAETERLPLSCIVVSKSDDLYREKMLHAVEMVGGVMEVPKSVTQPECELKPLVPQPPEPDFGMNGSNSTEAKQNFIRKTKGDVAQIRKNLFALS